MKILIENCILHKVKVPIKLTKIYIEIFLVHKISVSVQEVVLKKNFNLSNNIFYLIWK